MPRNAPEEADTDLIRDYIASKTELLNNIHHLSSVLTILHNRDSNTWNAMPYTRARDNNYLPKTRDKQPSSNNFHRLAPD